MRHQVRPGGSSESERESKRRHYARVLRGCMLMSHAHDAEVCPGVHLVGVHYACVCYCVEKDLRTDRETTAADRREGKRQEETRLEGK